MSTCWLYTDIKVSLDQFKTKYRWTHGELLLISWVMVQTACHRNTFVNNSLAIYRGTFTVLDCYRTLHIQEILECKVHSVLCSLIQPVTHTRQGKKTLLEKARWMLNSTCWVLFLNNILSCTFEINHVVHNATTHSLKHRAQLIQRYHSSSAIRQSVRPSVHNWAR